MGVVLWVLEERHVVGLRGDDVRVLLKATRVGVDAGHRTWHKGIAAGGKEGPELAPWRRVVVKGKRGRGRGRGQTVKQAENLAKE